MFKILYLYAWYCYQSIYRIEKMLFWGVTEGFLIPGQHKRLNRFQAFRTSMNPANLTVPLGKTS